MSRKILITTLALSLFGSFNAFANEGKINERKAKVSAHIDSKIALLNEFKTCVSGASAKGDIKNCRKTHKGKMKDLRSEFKASRKNK